MRSLLITAGPTQEPIDAVRYIANRSTGLMGIALAEAASRRGLPVTLLLGPTTLSPRTQDGSSPTTHRFRTASDLKRLLATHWPHHDVLIMAAAVSDYRPVNSVPTGKLPHRNKAWRLELEPTPDLLAELAATSRPDQTRIGFALEPEERLIASARRKLVDKNLAAIVANPLQTIASERISATVLLCDGRTLTPPTPPTQTSSKHSFAEWLLDQLETICSARPKASFPADSR